MLLVFRDANRGIVVDSYPLICRRVRDCVLTTSLRCSGSAVSSWAADVITGESFPDVGLHSTSLVSQNGIQTVDGAASHICQHMTAAAVELVSCRR